MTIRVALLAVLGLAAATVVGDDFARDRDMLAQTRAPQTSPAQTTPADPPAGQLDELERQALNDATIAAARLELIRARKGLAAEQWREAAQRARQVLALLRKLPADVDVSVYELQAEGILARVQRATGGAILAGDTRPDDAATEAEMKADAPEDSLEERVQTASGLAQRYTGADTGDIDTTGDADLLRERTLRRQWPDEHGYRPGREVFDRTALERRDEQRLYYQDALRDGYKSDEARLLVEANEARVAPQDVVSYPDDWPQKVAKRERYKDGVIARSPSWVDKDGREWYVAIYDIHDLIYVPPDFYNTEGIGMNPMESLRTNLDRGYLRLYSDVFNGFPEDLAAGIPLLRYFGGVDDFALRGPKYSLERQQQIVDLIRAFVGDQGGQGRIEAIGP